MASQTLENARKLTLRVSTANTEHVLPATRELDAQLEQQGLTPLSQEASVAASEGNLKATFAAYEAAELDLAREVGEDSAERQALKATVGRAYRTVVSLAADVQGTYGRETAEDLELTGSTPDSPDPLVSRLKAAIAKLTPEAIAALPPIEEDGEESWKSINLTNAVAILSRRLTSLEADIATLAEESRQTQLVRSNRDKARKRWQSQMRFNINQARNVLTAAGREDLADRILPTETQIINISDPSDPD